MAGNYKRARATDGKKLEVGRTFQAEHRQGSEAQLTQLKNQREQALWAGVESPGTKLRMWWGTGEPRAGLEEAVTVKSAWCKDPLAAMKRRSVCGTRWAGSLGSCQAARVEESGWGVGGDHWAISGSVGPGPGSMGGAAGLEGRC